MIKCNIFSSKENAALRACGRFQSVELEWACGSDDWQEFLGATDTMEIMAQQMARTTAASIELGNWWLDYHDPTEPRRNGQLF